MNGNIEDVNQELGGGTVLPTIGYRDSNGIDYTLTATKTIPPDVLGRPLILTAGLRLSEASQLGFLGFGDEYRPTFEGSVAFLPLDRVLVAYKLPTKSGPLRAETPRCPRTSGGIIAETQEAQLRRLAQPQAAGENKGRPNTSGGIVLVAVRV